jgi:hypothetical protein
MRCSAPVNISLADKGMILAYGPDHANIKMPVEGKWCPGYLEDVWCVPDIGRPLFSVLSVAEHGIGVIIKCQRIMFQWSACGNRPVDDGYICHGHTGCGPKRASGI